MIKRCIVIATGLLAGVLTTGVSFAKQTPIQRGEYLLNAGGCISCHTEDQDDAIPLTGGRALETPFGIFYSPNITPDFETGIGSWSDENFLNAIWNGISPQGKSYFPAFPYTSYTGISRDDALAIKAYLFNLKPVQQANREHDLPWYLSTRLAAGVWKWFNFTPGRFQPDPDADADWNRGAYLVGHLGHCGECHTPRNFMGALISYEKLSGTANGPDGKKIPNITPDRDSGIGRWSESDITFFLYIGMQPGGDFVGSSMVAVIDDNTSRLSDEDRQAIAVYLKSVPPIGTAAK
jgi:mono/diheme cytochrome c family protein